MKLTLQEAKLEIFDYATELGLSGECNTGNLYSAIMDEYESGFKGTVQECLQEIHDTIGMQDFGLYEV